MSESAHPLEELLLKVGAGQGFETRVLTQLGPGMAAASQDVAELEAGGLQE